MPIDKVGRWCYITYENDVPLWKNGTLWGVLDIDSPIQNRFTPQDQAGLEQLAAVVESVL